MANTDRKIKRAKGKSKTLKLYSKADIITTVVIGLEDYTNTLIAEGVINVDEKQVDTMSKVRDSLLDVLIESVGLTSDDAEDVLKQLTEIRG